MTLTQYTLAAGPAGTALAVGTDGVASLSGSPTPTYTNTNPGGHGAFGMAVPATAGSAVAVAWPCAANGSFSVYGTITTVGTGSANLITPRNTSSVAVFKVRATVSGSHFDLTDSAGAVVATSTITYPAVNTPIRIDCQYSGTTTMAVKLRFFIGSNVEGFAPDDEISGSFANSLTVGRIGLGTQGVTWGAIFGGIIRTYDVAYWPVPIGAAGASSNSRTVATDTNNGWTAVGAASIHAAMADETDSSYGKSGSTGTTLVIERLAPLSPPTTATLALRILAEAAPATADIQLLEGTVVKQTWASQAIGTSYADYSLTLDPGTIAAISDWGNVYFSVVYAA